MPVIELPKTILPDLSQKGIEHVSDFDMSSGGVSSWMATGTPTTRENLHVLRSRMLHVVGDGAGDGVIQNIVSDPENGWNMSASYRIRVISGTVNVKVNDGTADLVDRDHTDATFTLYEDTVVSTDTNWSITITCSGGSAEFYIDWFSIRKTNALVGAYLNKSVINSLDDYSSYGNDGSFGGSPFPLKVGYRFDGAADYGNIDAILGDLADSSRGTFIMWVNPDDSTPATVESFLCFGDTNANELLMMGIDTNGKLFAQAVNNGTTQFYLETDASPFTSGSWTRIGLVQDVSTPVLYADGVAPDQTFTNSTDIGTWFNGLVDIDNARIADRNYNGGGETNHFDGDVQGIEIYDHFVASEDYMDYEYNKAVAGI